MKKVAILGSTGSIGTQTLEVISDNKNIFEVELLTAFSNHTLLINQALLHKPKAIIFGDRSKEKVILNSLKNEEIEIYFGEESLNNFLNYCNPDIVLTALVGKSGLIPTINTIKKGIDLALANKETLVVAGSIINKLCKEKKVNIYPVDSEHSAIFQCLVGESRYTIDKIILTASGGPFRNKKLNELKNISKKEALNHPNWEMGEKITIDSSTLMNKGLEVIEAKWLFNLSAGQIDVIVHPQSIIHSIVQFQDGSMKAQMGLPDMKLPIQYALTYPDRFKTDFERFNFMDYPELTFEQPDKETFINLKLAYNAMEEGGTKACALNAANEIAVEAFLRERISFTDIFKINEETMLKLSSVNQPSLSDYIETDMEARRFATSLI